MVAGPRDGPEAGRHGRLRASDADREQVIGTLKAAFVEGRLTKDDLEARAGQAFAARTHAELTLLTADLPAGLADAVPHGRAVPAQARQPMSMAAKAGIWITIAVGVPVVLAVSTGSAGLFLLPAAGLGGQESSLRPSAGPDQALPVADRGRRHTAEAQRRRPFRYEELVAAR